MRRVDYLPRGVLPTVVCPLNVIAKLRKAKSLTWDRIEAQEGKKKKLCVCVYIYIYIHTYLLTYLLTYSLHGAESFLRS